MPTLDEIEVHIQTLLEIHLLKHVPGYKLEDRVYQQIAAAMHGSLKEVEGKTYAPNAYKIIGNPTTLERWERESGLLKNFGEALKAAGEEAGFHFFADPTLTLYADSGMIPEVTRIIASFNSEDLKETRGIIIDHQDGETISSIPPNAFLILDGKKIFPLNVPVLNIGRRFNNQVIIDDLRVSRTHAQLRVTKDHFSIFDLDSTGGTYVNGQRINHATLYPGDVISLAGVTLIFGQDMSTTPDTGKVTAALKGNPSVNPGVDFPLESIQPGPKNRKKK